MSAAAVSWKTTLTPEIAAGDVAAATAALSEAIDFRWNHRPAATSAVVSARVAAESTRALEGCRESHLPAPAGCTAVSSGEAGNIDGSRAAFLDGSATEQMTFRAGGSIKRALSACGSRYGAPSLLQSRPRRVTAVDPRAPGCQPLFSI